MTKPAIERFKDKIKISESGCHEWTARLSEKGYGVFKGEGRPTWQAHRWIYYYTNGPIPHGMYILHKCDNRKCVNVDHLYMGDQFDNMRDMWQRGRGVRPKGVDHSKTYFTDAQVSNIKGLAAIGLQAQFLSKIFHSNISTIHNIIKGDSWSHVPAPKVIGSRTNKPRKPGRTWRHRKVINMLSVDGAFIRRFTGITQAATYIKRDTKGFREVMNGRQATWGGYKWEYASRVTNENKKQPGK